MRFDNIGLFWEDLPTERKRGAVVRPMPAIPDVQWSPPTSFPDLSRANVISVDTETYDPELIEHGPGWARGKGHIVGVSVGADCGGRWYFPVAHETEPEFNMDLDKVFAWLRDTLSDPKQPKVGANLLYDLGWLRHHNIEVAGDLYDVQYAEALLDERAHVGLDILGEKYLGEGKETSILYQWLSDWFGGNPNGKQRKWIYKAPPRLVGPYAESDADLPLRLMDKLYPLIVKEGLLEVFNMECGLMRLMLDMRYAGVSVDIDATVQARETLLEQEQLHMAKLKHLVGFEPNVNAGADLAMAFDKIGLKYPRTLKGSPSFRKEFLEGVNHPVGALVREVRKCQKTVGTFIDSYILDSHINGKVYGQFHLLRGDEGGTRSGRFSSSTPNLQNIPARDDIIGPLLRALFIPDSGHIAWRKYDYSQIEYRFLIHYAVGKGAEDVRRHFNLHPDTDYHELTRNLVHKITGILLDRKPIKNINFGLIYGMGIAALSAGLGLSKKEGRTLFAAYHKGVPFARDTMNATSAEAENTGIITTILGRRSRFDLYEPAAFTEGARPLAYKQAVIEYGNIKRAGLHKALNRRLQGSAADLMKKAMLICYNDGIFAETGVPRLTVHDELDFSDPGGKDEAFREMRRVLETAVPLRIPVKADFEIGPNWGAVKEIEDE